MIEFEIINSYDYSIIGKHQSQKDKLVFGRSRNCDLIIADPSVSLAHISIDVEEKLTLTSLDDNYFLYEGKKVRGELCPKLGETISIGNTSIKILSFTPTPNSDEQELFNSSYTKISNENPEVLQVLNDLELEIKAIERDKYVE